MEHVLVHVGEVERHVVQWGGGEQLLVGGYARPLSKLALAIRHQMLPLDES